MTHVVLVHWNPAEAEARAERLRRAGFKVRCRRILDPSDMKALWLAPPDAFVIDLGRRPSDGRAVGVVLRLRAATRQVPIVFVGGEPEKVERVRTVLPDAGFSEWRSIRGALRRSVGRKPRRLIVPASSMDAYKGTPLPKKLGIGPDVAVILLGAPSDLRRRLGAQADRGISKPMRRVTVFFARTRQDLLRRLPTLAGRLREGDRLWIAWPKQQSGVTRDLTQVVVRKIGLAAGLVDFKICAIDETWSGLLFTRRRLPPHTRRS